MSISRKMISSLSSFKKRLIKRDTMKELKMISSNRIRWSKPNNSKLRQLMLANRQLEALQELYKELLSMVVNLRK